MTTNNLRRRRGLCSFGGYRWFCSAWWDDLLWYVTGVSFENFMRYREITRWWQVCTWGLPGWMRDVHSFWHRGVYGWAPRDTWSLDAHLNAVLAGSLVYLADHSNGAPAGYPSGATRVTGDTLDIDDATHFEQWDADLRRWALVFSEDPQDVAIFDRNDDYKAHRAEEDRRRANLHQALKEIEPWWEALWS